jgi:hypothetical protein
MMKSRALSVSNGTTHSQERFRAGGESWSLEDVDNAHALCVGEILGS